MKLRWSLIVISGVDERQEGQLPHDTARSREHRLSGLTRRYGTRVPAGPSLALKRTTRLLSRGPLAGSSSRARRDGLLARSGADSAGCSTARRSRLPLLHGVVDVWAERTFDGLLCAPCGRPLLHTRQNVHAAPGACCVAARGKLASRPAFQVIMPRRPHNSFVLIIHHLETGSKAQRTRLRS